jgi:GT2 family glycosyltransferase
MTLVVVVNWNSGSLLGGCLRSLTEFAPGCRAVVVDNASDYDRWRLPAESNRFTLLRNPCNEGFAGIPDKV